MLTPLSTCNVCGSSELEELINLPDLPLTGLYYPTKYQTALSPTFDQAYRSVQIVVTASYLII